MKFTQSIPLSLYIHIPWCIRKCPYCDFNSHRAPKSLPEDEYINALIQDLENELPKIWGRRLVSIFIGGGTPSLFSPQNIEKLIQAIYARIGFAHPDIEITMEANPGTFEQQKFKDFRLAGINRLSIGIQSFQADKLKALGRIHNDNEAKKAVEIAHNSGFTNFNLDLMHGLPNQTIEDALYDLQTAIAFKPPHLSWYQLTLEPNTVFAKHPPTLPQDENLWDIQQAGHEQLIKNGYKHYEISAYAKKDAQCTHNLNYWQFGDYLGIGAGAHSKITDMATQTVTRSTKPRNPKDFMKSERSPVCSSPTSTALSFHPLPLSSASPALSSDLPSAPPFSSQRRLGSRKLKTLDPSLRWDDNAGEAVDNNIKTTDRPLTEKDLPLEFMMNALRLVDGVDINLFSERTGLSLMVIQSAVLKGQVKNLLAKSSQRIKTTELGQRFLNECLQLFND